MPILISQFLTRPVLYTMGVMNIAALGVCSYFVFAPLSPSSISFSNPQTFSQGSFSAGHSDRIATLPVAVPNGPAGKIIKFPSSGAAIPSLDLALTESSNLASGPHDLKSLQQQSLSPRDVSASEAFLHGEGTQAQESQRTQSSLPRTLYTGPTAPVPVAASVPLAFTAFNGGTSASPSDQDTLRNLQKEFVKSLSSGGAAENDDSGPGGSTNPGANDGGNIGSATDPNSRIYAEAWQAAQVQNDAKFRRLFGWQTFVQYQLAQLHGQ